jgi:hypothetical protein
MTLNIVNRSPILEPLDIPELSIGTPAFLCLSFSSASLAYLFTLPELWDLKYLRPRHPPKFPWETKERQPAKERRAGLENLDKSEGGLK